MTNNAPTLRIPIAALVLLLVACTAEPAPAGHTDNDNVQEDVSTSTGRDWSWDVPTEGLLPNPENSGGGGSIYLEPDIIHPTLCEMSVDADAIVWGQLVDYGRRHLPTYRSDVATNTGVVSDEPCESPGGPFAVVIDVYRVVGDSRAAVRRLEVRLGQVELWLNPIPGALPGTAGETAADIGWSKFGDNAGQPLAVGQFIGLPIMKVPGHDFWMSDTRFIFTEVAGTDGPEVYFQTFRWPEDAEWKVWPPVGWEGRGVTSVLDETESCRVPGNAPQTTARQEVAGFFEPLINGLNSTWWAKDCGLVQNTGDASP